MGQLMKNCGKLAMLVAAFCATAESDPAKFFHTVEHRSADVASSVDPDYKLVVIGGDLKSFIAEEASKGNELIGYSTWNGQQVSKGALLKFGRKLGATLVAYASKYTGTVNAGAIGSSTFSRNSAFSFAIPINVNRLDQIALYFRHAPRMGIGIGLEAITQDERQRLGTNMGVKVGSVIPGGPAFMADILPGDIITTVGDQKVYDSPSLRAAISAGYGKETTVVINRSGAEVKKTIKLAPDGVW